MAVHVERHESGSVKSMIFRCDAEGCAASPTDDEIIEAGGLTKMGWLASGGRHFCPIHNPTREEQNV